MRASLALLIALVWLSGAVHADNPAYVSFEGESLAQGRTIWLGTCEGCHGYGIAGAPIPMEAEEWAERLDQPLTLLYQHALEGFFGPGGTYMPPRGGNDALTDAEVKLAVDYMTTLARHYQPTNGDSQ